MKIYRDGKAIELTAEEVRSAHMEFELECMLEDINSIYAQDEYDYELSDKEMREVAYLSIHNLNHNDSYYEQYWDTANHTLFEYINEKIKEA